MGSFMGKTKIYYEFKRKNVNCYSCPAYRATLLFNMCTETDSPLICLCKTLDKSVDFYGQYRGHLGNIVDKSLRAHSANVTIEHETKLK